MQGIINMQVMKFKIRKIIVSQNIIKSKRMPHYKYFILYIKHVSNKNQLNMSSRC